MKAPLIATTLGLAALVTAQPAAAEQNRINPYECEQDRRNSQLAGTIIGGIIGAAIGHEVAAKNTRDEGLLLGGALGAAIGAGAGSDRVACAEPQPHYRQTHHNRRQYNKRYYHHSRVDQPRRYTVYRDDDHYDRREYDRYEYDRDYDRDYAHREPRPRYAPKCKMGESRIQLPDGRIDTRAVKMCRGEDGVWRVVDR